jgi:hypothetical protein
VAGAVYRPFEEMLPPEADQVTAVFVVPVTVAVNCCVVPDWIDGDLGLMPTAIAGVPAETVTAAEADLVESATLVAVTVKVPAVAGAV